MNSEAAAQTQKLLERIYREVGRAEAPLAALLDCLRPHLRRHLNERGIAGEDLEELCGETLQRLLAVLRRSCEPDAPRIGDIAGYGIAVADSVFRDYLRRTKPNWFRLKRRVTDVLEGRGNQNLFARWRLHFDWLGGLARWQGQPFRATERYRLLCAGTEGFCTEALENRDATQVPLVELLARLFVWLGTPLELDDLTNRVATLQHIHDSPPLSLEGMSANYEGETTGAFLPSAEDVAANVIAAVSSEQRCAHLWRQVRALLPRQRVALLLGMERACLLLLAGTGSRVADALDIPRPEFAALWRVLPLPDKTIAERLQITPKQVSNLRKCARERLARWLAKNEEMKE